MERLTLGDLKKVITGVEKKYGKDVAKSMVVIIGNDEELNGLHTAYFAQDIDPKQADEFDFNGCCEDIRQEKTFLIS